MEAHQQQQQQQTQRELDKLRAIDAKVKQVQDKMATRLPNQYAHLAAMVCGMTWYTRMQLAKMQPHEQRALYDQLAKKMRMELGAFDYQAKEQGELLTRYLCDLDNILSFGNAEVKEARKALVVFIQSLLVTADALKAKSAKLKQFGEQMIARLPEPVAVVTVESTSNELEPEEAGAEQVNEEDVSMAQEGKVGGDTPMKPLFTTDEDEEDNEGDEDWEMVGDDDEPAEEDNCQAQQQSDNDDDESEDEGDEQDDDGENQDEQDMAEVAEPQLPRLPRANIDVRFLPVWRPYYQIQKRRDGVYLVANLRGIDRDDFRVQWNEDAGVLRISGVKRPTQKDIMLSRFSGVPTFGRFEIAERFPANALNMDEASQVLGEDGTLEIRMPFYTVQYPVHVLRRPYFDPFAMQPRCMVW
uniref:BAG domain-containing protein n=1 Tax=Globisporangium ultimum (strain ATCC 200006 / CBS 805.95 / DAOM BR144) TaxID=431595 RepID=K3WWD3_GLOUD